jgi:hypothetical protein
LTKRLPHGIITPYTLCVLIVLGGCVSAPPVQKGGGAMSERARRAPAVPSMKVTQVKVTQVKVTQVKVTQVKVTQVMRVWSCIEGALGT